jgi:hypothetical protein
VKIVEQHSLPKARPSDLNQDDSWNQWQRGGSSVFDRLHHLHTDCFLKMGNASTNQFVGNARGLEERQRDYLNPKDHEMSTLPGCNETKVERLLQVP